MTGYSVSRKFLWLVTSYTLSYSSSYSLRIEPQILTSWSSIVSEILTDIAYNCKGMPLVPDTQEADLERSAESKSSRPASAPWESPVSQKQWEGRLGSVFFPEPSLHCKLKHNHYPSATLRPLRMGFRHPHLGNSPWIFWTGLS